MGRGSLLSKGDGCELQNWSPFLLLITMSMPHPSDRANVLSRGKGLTKVSDFQTRAGELKAVSHLGKHRVVLKGNISTEIGEWWISVSMCEVRSGKVSS